MQNCPLTAFGGGANPARKRKQPAKRLQNRFAAIDNTTGGLFIISFDLTGKVAIVTGASQGLGKDMARGLAEAGADVVIMARRLEKLEEVAKEISASTGRKIVPVYVDVTKMDVMQEAVGKVMEMFGKIDILVNNAALIDYTPAVDLTPEAYDRVLDANVKGPFLFGKRGILRYMKEHGGNIINIWLGQRLPRLGSGAHIFHFQGGRYHDDPVPGNGMGQIRRVCKRHCPRPDYAGHG